MKLQAERIPQQNFFNNWQMGQDAVWWKDT